MGGLGSAASHGIGFFSSSLFMVFPPFREYLFLKNEFYTVFTFSLTHGKIK